MRTRTRFWSEYRAGVPHVGAGGCPLLQVFQPCPPAQAVGARAARQKARVLGRRRPCCSFASSSVLGIVTGPDLASVRGGLTLLDPLYMLRGWVTIQQPLAVVGPPQPVHGFDAAGPRYSGQPGCVRPHPTPAHGEVCCSQRPARHRAEPRPVHAR